MLLLVTYLAMAVGVSFLCSVVEAVLLSITPSFIALAKQQGRKYGKWLDDMQEEIDRPLAAILTLNTIAHTVGAAGTGAQAAKVLGEGYLGVVSAVLTFVILVFSEIIPKTLGARYWQTLAPSTAYCLHKIMILLKPFLFFAGMITKGLATKTAKKGLNRDEFLALAELSVEEDQLEADEYAMVHSLFKIHKITVKSILTPRTVVFSIPETMTISEFIAQHRKEKFSRIPLYSDDHENLMGFVLLSDILKAKVAGEADQSLKTIARELPVIPQTLTVLAAFRKALAERNQILSVVDEYGGFCGILTLEDIIESVLGLEIVDEGDKVTDMQQLAKLLWQHRKRN